MILKIVAYLKLLQQPQNALRLGSLFELVKDQRCAMSSDVRPYGEALAWLPMPWLSGNISLLIQIWKPTWECKERERGRLPLQNPKSTRKASAKDHSATCRHDA